MVKLTAELMKSRLKTDSLEDVKKLNVWGCDIDDISILASFPSLEILSLSVNKISSLKPLQYLHNLRECYLRKNDIEHLDEAEYLRELKNLRVLWLDDNPCADEANYRKRVIEICPFLTTLDNRFVTKEEVQEAVPGYVRPSTPPPEPHPDQRRRSLAQPADPTPEPHFAPPPPATARPVQAETVAAAPQGEVGFYNPGAGLMTQSFHAQQLPQSMTASYHPALQHQHSTPEQQAHPPQPTLPSSMTQSFHQGLAYPHPHQQMPPQQPFQPIPQQQYAPQQQQHYQHLPPTHPINITGGLLQAQLTGEPAGGYATPQGMMSQSMYGSLPSQSHATLHNPGFQSLVQAKLSAAEVSPQPSASEDNWGGFDELAEERADEPTSLTENFARFGVRRSLTRGRQNRSRSVSPSRLQRQENVLTAILHLMEDLDADGLRILIDQAHDRIKKQR